MPELMPSQRHMKRYATYTPALVLELIGDNVRLKEQSVPLTAKRYEVWRRDRATCQQCGLEATHFALERPKGATNGHLTPFGIDHYGREVCLTIDHIVPQMLGGDDETANLQTLCQTCHDAKTTRDTQSVETLREAFGGLAVVALSACSCADEYGVTQPAPKPALDASKRGKRSKRKGYAREKEWAVKRGGERVPLSGSLGGRHSGDVQEADIRWECKARATSGKLLYRWLERETGHGVDKVVYSKAVRDGRKKPPTGVAFRMDNSNWLVLMGADEFERLCPGLLPEGRA